MIFKRPKQRAHHVAAPTHEPAGWPGAILGCAYGDAWGYQVEFDHDPQLTYGLYGPEFPEQATISDDTQMTLALAAALHSTRDGGDLQQAVIDEFVHWLDDPDNNRAPGATCLASLRIARSKGWPSSSWADSKGCGANMRVSPAAFLPSGLWEQVAAWQAAVTHGHPTAVTASVLTAAAIRATAHGDVSPGGLLAWACAETDRRARDLQPAWISWLAPLLEQMEESAESYLARGWEEMRSAAERAHAAQPAWSRDPWRVDPCQVAGDGWVAEEALAVALLCADLAGQSGAVDGLRRAAATAGDSDSIACIAGALLGAGLPIEVWPTSWKPRLEPRYQQLITQAQSFDLASWREYSPVDPVK